ncbi:2-(1,2-epoxy-1,2-dihydrophenyl)acetyl-CoA isomerase [Paracoccus limosus]|jgi:2-(1,2-epoxy-1,2-dihydrophenyl)acetyl-CoA isomerase|uniref:2-(1,2-epoxy-1,2-dihydrophenyl)acetyl-CoA isomerase n=1 Tax=Paracoccus limosus TaxID=913252 RepID=A0A844GZ86_9RHOB|nr:enoyl-CoA hydratase-related protein [Paracoccus limosus]MTH33949.1 2-(1,2-epoxy-1,2-dihydrophenyl)acetyl-CoA isomerase [Paracoccus limosus]
MTDSIRISHEAGVTTLALNRPEVMNALNRDMRAAITAALRDLPTGTRCVVLTGSGRAFCSGQDLGDAAAGLDVERILREEYEPMLAAITGAPVPVIAAVNGVAAGAGANLALAADVVIACESARFVQAFSRIGLIPDAGGTHILPRAVGLARAMGMMLFAEPVPARQAADWGLIWEAVPDGDFAQHVAQRARALAEGPTQAFLAIRTALLEGAGNGLAAQLALEAQLQGRMAATADFAEGVAAFVQKRPPRFTGR